MGGRVLKDLLVTLFDPESLTDENGAKSSNRRAVLLQLLLIFLVIIVGFLFSLWKNQIGRDFCMAVLGVLGVSTTGTAWAGQNKSKDVLVAQASSANPFAATNTQPTPPPMISSPVSALPPQLISSGLLADNQTEMKRENRRTFSKVLRVISIMSSLEHLAPRTVPQPPFIFLSKKDVQTSASDMIRSHLSALEP